MEQPSPPPAHPAPPGSPAQAASTPSQPGAGAPPDPGTLRAAYNAFKKRWKLTRLDQESGLGGGRPVTGGRQSNIAGIEPPREWGRAVWAELAKQGRIRDCRDGFYGMP